MATNALTCPSDALAVVGGAVGGLGAGVGVGVVLLLLVLHLLLLVLVLVLLLLLLFASFSKKIMEPPWMYEHDLPCTMSTRVLPLHHTAGV